MSALFRKAASLSGDVLSGLGASPRKARIDGVMLNIDLTHFVDAKYFWTRKYEPLSMKRMVGLISAGDRVLDVGANIGIMTLQVARKVGPSGHVVAFEPSDYAFDRLVANIDLNGFANVTPVKAAVGSAPLDAVEMTLPQGYLLNGGNTARTQSVKIWSIDAYLAGKRVDFIKIDTDGWEQTVFDGAHETIAAHRPCIMFEFCPSHAESKDFDPLMPFELLGSFGYTFETESGAVVDGKSLMSSMSGFASENVFAMPPARTG